MSHPQSTYRNTIFSTDSFFARRREVVRSTTLLYQLEVLKKTGRYEAFKLKWHPVYDEEPLVWPVPNHLFWDSDVAKWIEGACYFLSEALNEEIDHAVQELVTMIQGALQPDGYLNIHFTVVKPEDRFTNLRDLHELYNAGHLIEAALAHHQHYGNTLLLDPVLAYVSLLVKTLGPEQGQIHGYPGHPEIELALLRLYALTQDFSHFGLAKYFITERGNPKGCNGRHFYDVEGERRGASERDIPSYYPARRSYWYQQAQRPILEQDNIQGHSVRALYLLTAVADLVRIDSLSANKNPYKQALEMLWHNMVSCKMYLTGGIGSIKKWEGFSSLDYFLPQSTDEGGCYAETCAAIGVVMLAERMLQIDLDTKYTDIMELSLYNAVLTGMSHDGQSFTYENQLASSDSSLSQREKWFTVSCCPPNVTRLLGYLGGCVWSWKTNSNSEDETNNATINVHLYTSATLKFSLGSQTIELTQQSNYPFSGIIHFTLTNSASTPVTINLRIPSWTKTSYTLSPNLSGPSATLEKGYLTLPPTYLQTHKSFTLILETQPRLISPHPSTNQHTLTIARGPLIYCLEDFDNPWVDDHFKSLRFNPLATLEEHKVKDEKTGEEYIGITARNAARFLDVEAVEKEQERNPGPGLSADVAVREVRRDGVEDLKFVPYWFRANRGGKGMMRVGITRSQVGMGPVMNGHE